nr:hypothetical protein [Tanacetum cinerariifolium]
VVVNPIEAAIPSLQVSLRGLHVEYGRLAQVEVKTTTYVATEGAKAGEVVGARRRAVAKELPRSPRYWVALAWRPMDVLRSAVCAWICVAVASSPRPSRVALQAEWFIETELNG